MRGIYNLLATVLASRTSCYNPMPTPGVTWIQKKHKKKHKTNQLKQ